MRDDAGHNGKAEAEAPRCRPARLLHSRTAFAGGERHMEGESARTRLVAEHTTLEPRRFGDGRVEVHARCVQPGAAALPFAVSWLNTRLHAGFTLFCA